MNIQSLEQNDLESVANLLPPGWENSLPVIASYITSPFCFPIKVCIDQKIVGIGTTIIHQDCTAWLAHIVVDPNYRNRQIGKLITETLVEAAYAKGSTTVYLLATELGAPVYKKVGFEIETEYVSFKANQNMDPPLSSKNIVAFADDFKSSIFELDNAISGEDRSLALAPHLTAGFLFLNNHTLQGFYLPTLGDGLILAETPEAGEELMRMRLSAKNTASFPIDNVVATTFMQRNSYNLIQTHTRMRLGAIREWLATSIYNRIGGNLG